VGGHCLVICVRRMSYKSTGHSVDMVIPDTGHGQLDCCLTSEVALRAALCVVWFVRFMAGWKTVVILSLLQKLRMI